MEIVKLPIEKLNTASYNPRIDLKPGDKEYEKLKKSILTFGYIDPIIVNKRGYVVVGGHQRLKILQATGHKTVDVSLVDLPLDQEKALNIALNKTGGDWDLPRLQELLAELQETDMDIEITGFDDLEIENLLSSVLDEEEGKSPKKQAVEDDFDAEEEATKIKNPVTQPGDIWLLGRHRLLCGDATEEEDVRRLTDGKLCNMVFTDPPYNVAYVGKTADSLKIQNDSMADGDFYKFLFQAYTNMLEAVTPGGAIYVCHADTEGLNFRKAMVDAGWLLKQCLIWVKNSMVLGRQDYHWQHEPILYGWKPGAAHTWNSDRKQTTVWPFDRPSRSADHPTMKPLTIPANAIQNSSKTGDTVLDLFGGSGSTLIAAEQTGRICYTSELDPIYSDVIVARYIAQVGSDQGVYLLRNGEKKSHADVARELTA